MKIAQILYQDMNNDTVTDILMNKFVNCAGNRAGWNESQSTVVTFDGEDAGFPADVPYGKRQKMELGVGSVPIQSSNGTFVTPSEIRTSSIFSL